MTSTAPRVARHVLPEADQLMTPREVAAVLRVDPRTVARWARASRLNPVRTLGGHRRYRTSEVRDLVEGAAAEGTAGP